MPTYLAAIDLQKNELRNARIQNLSSAPVSPVAGQIYFDTNDNQIYAFDGTSWEPTSTPYGPAAGDLDGFYPDPQIGVGVITNAKISNTAGIALSKLATNPLARANHTGTQLASTISDFDSQVAQSSLGDLQAANTDLDIGGHQVRSVGDPTLAQDAATKAYVDTATTGSAGGDLTGTYPNPTVAAGKIDNSKISATAAIALSKLAVDPLDRDNHTGTQTADTISDFDTQVRTSSLDQMTVPAANLNINSKKLTAVADPTSAQDAATKAYVDAAASSSSTGAAGGDLTGTYPNPTIGAGKVTNAQLAGSISLAKLATDPLARANHTGTQTVSTISDFVTAVEGTSLDLFAAPAADVDFAGFKLTGLLDPTGAQDAATKGYVDATALGLDVKESVRAASTGNLTLSGAQTVDGVSLSNGDRVLVKDQSSASANGIYVVAAGAWSRSSDTASMSAGLYTFVEEGTQNGDAGFLLTTDGAIVVGTTPIAFSQFSGAGQVVAGNGLTKTGNSLDIGGTLNRISVSSDGVDISTSYVGQATIDTLGTVDTGTWEATPVDIAYGGTGAATAVDARLALGAVGSFTALNGGGSSDIVTHNLGTLNVNVSLRLVSTGEPLIADVIITDANTVTVSYGSSPAAGLFAITVIG